MSAEGKIYTEKATQVPFIIRVLWFFILGWELTLAWIIVAWVLNLTIIGLPLGVWMLNRIPQVLTLKGNGGVYVTDTKTGQTSYQPRSQPPMIIRAIYFLLIGWWFSFFWALLGYLLCLTIIGLPLGVLMLNSMPFVTTLRA